MEAMLHVGAKLDKDTADNAANAVEQILKAAFDYRISDKVLLKSLDVLRSTLTVQNVTVSQCTFESDQSRRVEVIVPPEFTEANK